MPTMPTTCVVRDRTRQSCSVNTAHDFVARPATFLGIVCAVVLLSVPVSLDRTRHSPILRLLRSQQNAPVLDHHPGDTAAPAQSSLTPPMDMLPTGHQLPPWTFRPPSWISLASSQCMSACSFPGLVLQCRVARSYRCHRQRLPVTIPSVHLRVAL